MYVTLQTKLGYQMVSASWARQHFHEVLLMSQGGPVGIQRYSRVMAVVWGMPFRDQAARELRLAELEYQVPHLRRLLFHHRLALQLLQGDPTKAALLVDSACQYMDQERKGDLYRRLPGSAWRTLIGMPRDKMAAQMLRGDRWGFDLRCQSPFYVGARKTDFIERLNAQLKDCSDFEREHWQRENDEYKARCIEAKRRLYEDWQANWAQTVAYWRDQRRRG